MPKEPSNYPPGVTGNEPQIAGESRPKPNANSITGDGDAPDMYGPRYSDKTVQCYVCGFYKDTQEHKLGCPEGRKDAEEQR
jgi:hypothetical protein